MKITWNERYSHAILENTVYHNESNLKNYCHYFISRVIFQQQKYEKKQWSGGICKLNYPHHGPSPRDQ